MAMNPAARRRLAISFVIGGAGLIGAKLMSAAEDDPGALSAPVSAPRVREPESGTVGADPRPTSRTATRQAPAPAADLQLARLDALRGSDPTAADPAAQAESDRQARLFEPRSWQPPAPPPPKPPPPPPPQAPPFPYAYFGGLTDAGVRTAYFSKGGQVIAVRAGDVIDSVFRIDALDAQHIAMTYLPLDKEMQIQLGSAQ